MNIRQRIFKTLNEQRKKIYFLGVRKQWAHLKLDKANDEAINKIYAEKKQCQVNEKSKEYENFRQACNISVFNCYFSYGYNQQYIKITARYRE